MESSQYMPYQRVGVKNYDQDVNYTGSHKPTYQRTYDSCPIQIKIKGGDLSIAYDMLSYKLKLIHLDDTQFIFPFWTE